MRSPITTRAPGLKLLPEIVIAVPPPGPAWVGETFDTTGFGGVISSAAGRMSRAPRLLTTIRSACPAASPGGTVTLKDTWEPNQPVAATVMSGSLQLSVEPGFN